LRRLPGTSGLAAGYPDVDSSDPDRHNDETKAALARAFDTAWDRFIEIEGTTAATDDNRRRLAAQIVALAKSGESDEHRLGEAGLIFLRVLAEAARIGERKRGAAVIEPAHHPDDYGPQAYSPETVAAMSTALHLCLDELPLRIPSDALTSLSTSILDRASRGERNPERLRRHALDVLRARQ
jgi:hypothetical protein